jgi:hypothetical protein
MLWFHTSHAVVAAGESRTRKVVAFRCAQRDTTHARLSWRPQSLPQYQQAQTRVNWAFPGRGRLPCRSALGVQIVFTGKSDPEAESVAENASRCSGRPLLTRAPRGIIFDTDTALAFTCRRHLSARTRLRTPPDPFVHGLALAPSPRGESEYVACAGRCNQAARCQLGRADGSPLRAASSPRREASNALHGSDLR